jgi:hypothetical protein
MRDESISQRDAVRQIPESFRSIANDGNCMLRARPGCLNKLRGTPVGNMRNTNSLIGLIVVHEDFRFELTTRGEKHSIVYSCEAPAWFATVPYKGEL